MEKSLNYSDVYLIPEFSSLRSRSVADVSVSFLDRKFSLPICPSNMSSVIDERICRWLSENNYPYFMHRFGDIKDFIKKNQDLKLISISIGVKDDDKKLLNWIAENKYRVDWICIDIAHAHSILVKEMIEYTKNTKFGLEFTSSLSCGNKIISYQKEIKTYFPKIIAGNVCTKQAVLDLEKWGADAVKVGIAGGHACSTKNMTGFHIPMFSCAINCCKDSPVPIILDGGVRENGDISKALVAGMGNCKHPILVMCGSLFASCIDSPATTIQ